MARAIIRPARSASINGGAFGFIARPPSPGGIDQVGGGAKQGPPGLGVGGIRDHPATLVVDACERLSRDAPPPHVGGGFLRVSRDPVEQRSLRLRHHQIAPLARSRSTARMSKIMRDASAKRSATATMANPSWRTAKASPSSVAT